MLPRPLMDVPTNSELTTEAAEQLEGGLLLHDLADVAGPQGHTWDSLLASSAARITPQTLVFQTFSGCPLGTSRITLRQSLY